MTGPREGATPDSAPGQLDPELAWVAVLARDARYDGRFVCEAKEVLGGYWIIQVKSKEEAVEWGSRCPASDNGVIEVRQLQEFSDFPADIQKAAAELPEMQAQSGQGKRS